MDSYIVIIIGCFVIFVGCCVAFYFTDGKRLKKQKEKRKEQEHNSSGYKHYVIDSETHPNSIGGTNLDRFFVECVLSYSTDFSKQGHIEKAQMFAKRFNLKYPNGIEALYDEAYNEHLKITKLYQNEKIKTIREEEKKQKSTIEKYSEKRGKDKKISMLQDIADEQRKTAEAFRIAESIIIAGTQQKEKSWGLAGGIAEGIAGPFAGIAAALNVQAENEKIRAQNAANLQAVMPTFSMIGTNVSSCTRKAREIENEIIRIQDKLVEDVSIDEFNEFVSVTNITVDVTETGAIYISATIDKKKEAYIYGSTPAVIDGTILAIINDGQKEISAKLVLPINGVDQKVGVQGIALGRAQQGKKYDVKFEPYKIWKIEK